MYRALKQSGTLVLCFHGDAVLLMVFTCTRVKRVKNISGDLRIDCTCFVYSSQVCKVNNVILDCTLGLTQGRQLLE